MGTQAPEVRPVVAVRFAAAGAFHVENRRHRFRHTFGAAVPPGFEQHLMSAGKQPVDQRVDILLKQRLAACHFDEGATEGAHLRKHRVHTALRALIKRIGRVAPRTPEVTGGEADEHAGTPRESRFTLNRMEDLVNRQQTLLLSQAWACASAPPAGTIRLAKVAGTECSTRRPAPSAP